MKYTTLPSSFFQKNRQKFAAQMKPNTIAIFHSNDLVADNADSHYRFSQNSNMYYLSGLDQEEIFLVLFPDAPNEKWKEMLFIRETNAHIQVWEGWKYSKEEAREASGVENVHFYGAFDDMIRRMASHFDGIYIDVNEHERNSLTTLSSGHRLARKFREEFPAHQIYRSAPICEALRSVKEDEELVPLREAVQITEKAFRRVLSFVQPGVYEYEIEAEIAHEFLRNRATGNAYDPIIASGGNACVLHYTENKDQCKDGDLILMDFGAEYGNYSADLTRTIPVNGVYSPRQKAVYNAVLSVMRQATALLVPGTLIEDYHKEVGKIMEGELLGLGLIIKKDVEEQEEDSPVYRKYFMHGTSHFLGLDTHDVGNRYEPIKAGMVFTCEPGIYIPDEGFGVRIENDILVTDNGPVDLMESIPIEVEEIEALMRGE
ncbi:MAG: aminopeptidase P N-terminal domain-containing protein [Bacteroidota bacterium]